jgi:hypothetical protein
MNTLITGAGGNIEAALTRPELSQLRRLSNDLNSHRVTVGLRSRRNDIFLFDDFHPYPHSDPRFLCPLLISLPVLTLLWLCSPRPPPSHRPMATMAMPIYPPTLARTGYSLETAMGLSVASSSSRSSSCMTTCPIGSSKSAHRQEIARGKIVSPLCHESIYLEPTIMHTGLQASGVGKWAGPFTFLIPGREMWASGSFNED